MYYSVILQVNPGPDFKQTGSRLEKVVQLYHILVCMSCQCHILYAGYH